MTLAIECSKLSKTFGEGNSKVKALKDVDLSVHEGEFMMLMGPSGCGKTTLMSVIAGILRSDEGFCKVGPLNYEFTSSDKLANFRAKHIGFIFQSFQLIPTLTIAENVAIPLIIGGQRREDALRDVANILDMVGLGGRAEQMPSILSGGQQQRVAIARSIVHMPPLILCDEPTSALDHHTGSNILDLMKQMNKEKGITFLVITHDQRITKYADRIAYMDDGQITHVEKNIESAN